VAYPERNAKNEKIHKSKYAGAGYGDIKAQKPVTEYRVKNKQQADADSDIADRRYRYPVPQEMVCHASAKSDYGSQKNIPVFTFKRACTVIPSFKYQRAGKYYVCGEKSVK
jgi:hypothetical protein